MDGMIVAQEKTAWNVHLTPELEQLVQGKVQTGRYSSASEVVREALRLMTERDEVRTIQKEEIRKKIAQGLAALDQGKGIDGDLFLAQMEAELDEEIEAMKGKVKAQSPAGTEQALTR